MNGLRVTPDLFLRYVVWTKTICCCIADACAYRTLTAMARVPVPRDQGMIVAKDSESDEKGPWSASRWVLRSA